MAAALFAARRRGQNAVHHDGVLEGGANLEESPPEADSVKSGTLLKLSHGARWVPRHVTLTREQLCFSKMSTNNQHLHMLDYIPLHEISCVNIREQTGDSRALNKLVRAGSGAGALAGASVSTGGAVSVSVQFQRAPSHSTVSNASFEIKSLVQVVSDDDHDSVFSFIVNVVDNGHNCGRPTLLRAESKQEMEEWAYLIQQYSKEEIDRLHAAQDTMPFEKQRRKARDFYKSDRSQMLFGGIITLSYLIAMTESELRPSEGSSTALIFKLLETIFTCIFAAELAINLFGNWVCLFFRSPWNVFDAVVVVVSILGLILEELPGKVPKLIACPARNARSYESAGTVIGNPKCLVYVFAEKVGRLTFRV